MEREAYDTIHRNPAYHDSLGSDTGFNDSVFLSYLFIVCGSTFTWLLLFMTNKKLGHEIA